MKKTLVVVIFIIVGFGVYSQTEGIYVTEGGKVGVGVDNPAYTLEVGGTGSGSGILISTGDEAFIGWYDRNLKGLANSWGWYAIDGSTFLWDNLNAKERVTIKNNGNVGIGTTSPLRMLQVGSDIPAIVNETYFPLAVKTGLTAANSVGKCVYLYMGEGDTKGYLESYDYSNGTGVNLSINPNGGKVGIGTASPKAKLDVGSMLAFGELGTVLARSYEGNTAGDGTFLGVRAYNTQPTNCNSFAIEHSFYGVKNNSINFFRGGGMSGGFITINTNDNTEKVRINYDGNVAIGTTYTGSYKLNVAGKINCTELHINATKWADFVFDKDYNLRTLAEVETFISQNQHLPDVPSQAQVANEGISLGEMNAILLQKIEELTLYTIEQDKKIEKLQKLESEFEAFNKMKDEFEIIKKLLYTK